MVSAQRSGDLLGEDAGLAEIHKLYRCHDRLLVHKQAVFDHLVGRWRDLFNISYDVLLYDLTSTYFEADPPFPEGDKRRFGYSRDHRPDCVQIIIALVVTPDGLPVAYEVLPGNTADKTTLRGFLERIERQYGKARRVWLMDRGVPTEEVLAEMRAADPPVHYLVGTPKSRLTRLEKHLIAQPWQQARPGVQVKLLAQGGELYVLAQSRDRVAKERAMRRRQLKRLWARLKQLSTMQLTREELLMKLGAARDQSRTAWRLVTIEVAAEDATFSYRLDRNKLPADTIARRPVSVAHQSRRGRPRQAVEPLSAAGGGRGGVQEPQRRSGNPTSVSPTRGAHRGARLHCLLAAAACRDLAAEGAKPAIQAGQAAKMFRRCPGCRVCGACPLRSRYTGPPGSGSPRGPQRLHCAAGLQVARRSPP